jgi:hypothetical protein
MAAPIILTAVNDTLVFLAISYRVVSSATVAGTWRARTRSFFTGEGLYHLSKTLLTSGQVYYLFVLLCCLRQYSNLTDTSVTIGVDIISVAFVFSQNFPESLRPVLVSTYFVLASAMACRVFRMVLLGVPPDLQLNTTKIMSIYRSATQLHCDCDNKDTITTPRHKLDALSETGINVVAEAGTMAGLGDRYRFGERKLAGDDVRQDVSRRV